MATKKKSVKKVVKKSVKKAAAKPAKKAAPKNKVKNQQAKKANPAKKAAAKPAAKKTVKKASGGKTGAMKAAAKAQVKAAPKVQVDYTKAITPLLDRLVVRVMNSERVTAGGLLIIPDTALMATGYLKAEVLAVGSGNKSKKGYLKPLDVKVGDKVLFAEYAGTKVQFNSEELHIIHEADVMGILEE